MKYNKYNKLKKCILLYIQIIIILARTWPKCVRMRYQDFGSVVADGTPCNVRWGPFCVKLTVRPWMCDQMCHERRCLLVCSHRAGNDRVHALPSLLRSVPNTRHIPTPLFSRRRNPGKGASEWKCCDASLACSHDIEYISKDWWSFARIKNFIFVRFLNIQSRIRKKSTKEPSHDCFVRLVRVCGIFCENYFCELLLLIFRSTFTRLN